MLMKTSSHMVEIWHITCDNCGYTIEEKFIGENEPESITMYALKDLSWEIGEYEEFVCVRCQQEKAQLTLFSWDDPV